MTDETKDELRSVVARGEAIHQSLRPQLEPLHKGKYIIINVDTGEYEIDANYINASDRAHAKWPNVRCFVTKVGHDAIARFGPRRIIKQPKQIFSPDSIFKEPEQR